MKQGDVRILSLNPPKLQEGREEMKWNEVIQAYGDNDDTRDELNFYVRRDEAESKILKRKAPGWVDAKRKTPKHTGTVLAIYAGIHRILCYSAIEQYNDETGKLHLSGVRYWEDPWNEREIDGSRVTDWMELPKVTKI
jgi:hypothetical protein